MTALHIGDNVLARSVDDQIVLMNLDTGQCFALNSIAVQIWELLRKGDGPEAVVERLREEYDVEAAILRRDVDDVVDALIEQGLARDEAAGAP
ncbi:MAG TPA: PqqD family protein [Acidimicrobiales bacterium]|nr:PqqD family protein [Acidimicrobiales bacterium]